MKISVVTPTCDRPIGMRVLEARMRAQTRRPDEWIVADGGETPATCAMGQTHIHDARFPPGAANFCHNLLNGLNAASGELVVFCEDDDWYAPTHLATIEALALTGARLLGSEPVQRYYNVAQRRYLLLDNIGASLCQTAFVRELAPDFRGVVNDCMARGSFGVDTTFWRSVPRSQWAFTGERTVVGIKGLPGRRGLGIGHRPDGRWKADPDLAKLREWIGDDAESYADFRVRPAA